MDTLPRKVGFSNKVTKDTSYLHNPAGGWQLQSCSEAGAEMCPTYLRNVPSVSSARAWGCGGLSPAKICSAGVQDAGGWMYRGVPFRWLPWGKIPGKIMKFFTSTSWQLKVNCRGESRVYLGLQTCQNDGVLCFHLDCTSRYWAHSSANPFPGAAPAQPEVLPPGEVAQGSAQPGEQPRRETMIGFHKSVLLWESE